MLGHLGCVLGEQPVGQVVDRSSKGATGQSLELSQPPPHPASDNGTLRQLEKLRLVVQEADIRNQSYFEPGS